MAGIYIHIPFCKQLCRYCDFYFTLSLERKPEMLIALSRELELKKDFLNGENISTIYFGGGTPTICSPSEIQTLINKLKELYPSNGFEEVTIEANPDDLTDDYLEALSRTEVNRLSIGVQSFCDNHLMFFNRRHNSEQAYSAIKRAKHHGFRNITIDLIYGIPSMSESEWRYNLDKFLELEIPHLSAYHLTIEAHTIFGKMAKRGELRSVDDIVSMRDYNILESVIKEAGYNHYEVSNFAREGFHAIHNSNYWKGVHYIGIGPSAHSYNGHNRQWNLSSNIAYLRALEQNTYFETEALSNNDKYNEYLMTSLRTCSGVEYSVVEDKFGAQKLQHLKNAAAPFLKNGTLYENISGLSVPSKNFLLSDYIIERLLFIE